MVEPTILKETKKLAVQPIERDAGSILLVLEHPEPGHVINGQDLQFNGFAIAEAEITEVLIDLAGIAVKADYGIFREDIKKAYPDHVELASCGFSCKFDRELLAKLPDTSGDLPLNIVARDKNGQEKRLQSNLILGPRAKPEPDIVVQVDEHSIDRRGLLRVQGWAASTSPIESVNVYLGSEPIGLAEIGLDRPDVATAWPRFPTAAKSGFLLLTDATRFLAGDQKASRQITIVTKSASGLSHEAHFPLALPAEIVPRKLRETSEVFCDFANVTRGGRLSIGGWTISHVGVDRIRVIFDGAVVGVAEYGHDRPDVGNKFPQIAQSRKSGYRFYGSIEADKIRNDSTVTVESLFFDGNSRRTTIKPVVIESVESEPGPVEAPSASEEIHLHIDEPEVVDGKATKLVESTFAVNGWAVAKSGVESIEFELDSKPIGTAYFGIRREDVAKAFPTFGGDIALLSGYAFTLPHRFLVEGKHQVTVRLKTKGGAEKIQQFEVEIGTVGEQPGPWLLRNRMPAAELLLQQQLVDKMANKPTIYIHLDGLQNRVEATRQTLDSIERQSYKDWKLLITDGAKSPADTTPLDRSIRERLSSLGPQVIYLSDDAEAAELLAAARPRDLVLPMDAGDTLAVDALFQFALALNRDERTDFIYGDERKPNIGTNREDAFFKPDWSPTLLLSTNYIGRPWCTTVACFQQADCNFLSNFAENFDLVLRLTENAAQVSHVQRVLLRRDPANLEAAESEIKALKSTTKRRKLSVTVEDGLVPNTYHCRAKTKIKDKVSIVIPTCGARGLIKVCLDTLREKSTYKNIEIICIENIADDDSEWKPWLRDNCDVVVEIKEAFNWSLFNNVAAREASGEYLLFLNDDIEVIQPGWLEELLDLVRDDAVGIAGPQLLYPDRKVQHAGMFLAGGSIARHAFRFAAEDDPGYFGLALTQRDVMAVTGACMLMKTSTYEKIGGFDESHSVVNNDLDFCLRIHEQNLRCVYTPFASLIHHELASRKDIKDVHDVAAFNSRWGTVFAKGDPFYHPCLDKNSDAFQNDSEPAELVFAGRPLFRKEEIKRILAVKLDHIGDFITAFPALQRIKALFPEAELIALGAPASRAIARFIPAVDRVIPFEFFHARSQLGAKEIDEEAMARLKAELAPLDIDIAVDLRVQPDTRKVLQHTGARFTAGFDHRNQFPWLDVALPWEGDAPLVPKHHHVSDLMVHLVEAISTAGTMERSVFKRPPDWSAQQLPFISRLMARGLLTKPLVCVHPATGNEMRQWPSHRFGELIGALFATEDVDVCLVGGPDELDIANRVLEDTPEPERVHNLVGTMKLHELGYLFDAAALFIGNNSGPKHLAATLGTPTVGIHSGVVDAREWGPLGDTAVAIQRNMSCGPCYKATKDQCHRGIACLNGITTATLLETCRSLLQLQRGIRVPTPA